MAIDQWETLTRLLLAALAGGLIGFERELKGRDAGIRTHMLVSLGAAIITMIQLEASNWLLDFSRNNPELANVLTSDITRLTAQIVNGIGFLGAGTIIVSKRTVTGLTTAASIWAVASLGIAVGMGYYFIAIVGAFIMLIVLRLLKTLFKIDRTKQLEIKYKHRRETLNYLEKSFNEHEISVVNTDHSITYMEDGTSQCEDLYTLHLPNNFNTMEYISKVGSHPNILKINTIKTNFDN
ncbi:MAG: MgtC/SapB family protein [Alkalibacterium sp.]|uniref:Putative Mg2+ transporter-C (MgtC) family protein n=1 Tax=Alkalibacterium gilvum TaxID=1130080 RepID=A0A1H6T2P1_9LACT|nr:MULTISPECIES: MgtC/SapB family protein [Alkalibacterium]MDN6193945.1 MgtC/SapB family protein [Alkalibacterium sp.]MDN6293897.1 MgtC/SapB family protein [Alkalibacterium sp.]MDN6295858.1 MgtC/SapB family protein [Alkalibacterium sp.]MDN6327094.1 MgtC/SapB family protein [Alkalibacterium sp.]MDN6397953.1 MgtC/SapB family protein [Alkalibacterium sp.]